ncbi:MAG: pilus assembly protein PilP [Comamonas sp.]
MNSWFRFCWLPCLAFLVVGCSDEQENLQQWMQNEKASIRPSVKPIAPPKEFVPQSYMASAALDPFSKERLASVMRGSAAVKDSASDALVAPERARKKEQLESYPLDSFSMVGYLHRNASGVALVKLDGLIYQVTKGMHMGQNYGKVINISENATTLREVVQNGVGEWIEREAVLELQEAKK